MVPVVEAAKARARRGGGAEVSIAGMVTRVGLEAILMELSW